MPSAKVGMNAGGSSSGAVDFDKVLQLMDRMIAKYESLDLGKIRVGTMAKSDFALVVRMLQGHPFFDAGRLALLTMEPDYYTTVSFVLNTLKAYRGIIESVDDQEKGIAREEVNVRARKTRNRTKPPTTFNKKCSRGAGRWLCCWRARAKPRTHTMATAHSGWSSTATEI
eukprot:3033966-Prymnesium_polylepis.1